MQADLEAWWESILEEASKVSIGKYKKLFYISRSKH